MDVLLLEIVIGILTLILGGGAAIWRIIGDLQAQCSNHLPTQLAQVTTTLEAISEKLDTYEQRLYDHISDHAAQDVQD